MLGIQTRKCATQAPPDSRGSGFLRSDSTLPPPETKGPKSTDFEHHGAKYPLPFTVIMLQKGAPIKVPATI